MKNIMAQQNMRGYEDAVPEGQDTPPLDPLAPEWSVDIKDVKPFEYTRINAWVTVSRRSYTVEQSN